MYIELYFVIGIGLTILSRFLEEGNIKWGVLNWLLHIFLWPLFLIGLIFKLQL